MVRPASDSSSIFFVIEPMCWAQRSHLTPLPYFKVVMFSVAANCPFSDPPGAVCVTNVQKNVSIHIKTSRHLHTHATTLRSKHACQASTARWKVIKLPPTIDACDRLKPLTSSREATLQTGHHGQAGTRQNWPRGQNGSRRETAAMKTMPVAASD